MGEGVRSSKIQFGGRLGEVVTHIKQAAANPEPGIQPAWCPPTPTHAMHRPPVTLQLQDGQPIYSQGSKENSQTDNIHIKTLNRILFSLAINEKPSLSLENREVAMFHAACRVI